MRTIFVFIACLSLWINADCQHQSALPFSVPFQRLQIHSNHLNEDRMLNIYVPLGYDTLPQQHYDVIYLLDGSLDEDFIHVCGAVQFLSFPWINTCAPTIIVGIENVDRRRDFTFPTTVAEDAATWPTTGHSAAFISFLADELQPMINRQFRTTHRKILVGQSLGGLLGCQIYLEKNQLFTDYLIISPSLWWDNESLLRRYQAALSETPNLTSKIYMAVGREGKIMVGDAKRLHRTLKKLRKYEYNPPLLHLKDHDHADIGHLAVFYLLKEMHRAHQRREKF